MTFFYSNVGNLKKSFAYFSALLYIKPAKTTLFILKFEEQKSKKAYEF